ncbi:MAG: porin [Alphaproteobacteria bacterium]|nr:porin [Alphaproteobacteria bacterium]
MRKILLATTAFVGVAFAGAAHAAPASPISLNVGGYTDFVAGFYHEAEGTSANGARANHDFETEAKLNFDATGKAANGVEYGANIGLWNGSEAGTLWGNGGTSFTLNSGYVWLSGAFGKVLLGDEHGASDLFVYAPTVGEGQVDGRYTDFVDQHTLAFFQASGIDNTEHSTKVTYYTPKVGNETHKVQLGISFIPTLYDYGQSVNNYKNGAGTSKISPYVDVIKSALQYTGKYGKVDVTASAQLIAGSHSNETGTVLFGGSSGVAGTARDFTSYGFGTQVGYNGWTFGGSYTDLGHYNEVASQGKSQETYSGGAKYEFDKVAVAANYLGGKGYVNYLQTTAGTAPSAANAYVGSFNSYGTGAAYTWFPGLTSNIDGVLFAQKSGVTTDHDDGYVVLVSQKLAF